MSVQHLIKAAKLKNDEYYTYYEDIECYMKYWLDYLKGKVVYCPFDSDESEFVNYLKQKKAEGNIADLLYTSDDYRNHLDLFLKADVVISNPPFSILSEIYDYIKKLDVKFICIFPALKITCKAVCEDYFAGKIFFSYTNVSKFKTQIYENFNVRCIWCNNIKDTRKQEEQAKIDSMILPEIIYKGEKYKNVLKCANIMEYYLVQDLVLKGKYKYILLAITTPLKLDVSNFVYIDIVNIKNGNTKEFSKVLLYNKNYKEDSNGGDNNEV